MKKKILVILGGISKEREIRYSISTLVLYLISACSEKYSERDSVLLKYLPSSGEIAFNGSDTKNSFDGKGTVSWVYYRQNRCLAWHLQCGMNIN